MWTNLWPKFFSSAQCLSSSEMYRTCTLSIKVCLPLSLSIDCALLASSGRTKLEEIVLLTTFNPASMATGSSVAQYLPNRYSRTNTGTLAPTFTLRTRSLRTTLPANTEAAFLSSSGMALSHRNGNIDRQWRRQFCAGCGIDQVDPYRLLRNLFRHHDSHGVRLDSLAVIVRRLQLHLTRGILESV